MRQAEKAAKEDAKRQEDLRTYKSLMKVSRRGGGGRNKHGFIEPG